MDGTEPLVIHVLVASLARLRFHKELAGNFFAPVNLRRAWEKWPLRAVTLGIHGSRRHRGILNGETLLPARLAHIPGACRQAREYEEARQSAPYRNCRARTSAAAPPTCEGDPNSRNREHHVCVQRVPMRARSARVDQPQTGHGSSEKQKPGKSSTQLPFPERPPHGWQEQDCR